jgi:hypothetical protein
VCACVRVCVCACVRACVRVYVCVKSALSVFHQYEFLAGEGDRAVICPRSQFSHSHSTRDGVLPRALGCAAHASASSSCPASHHSCTTIVHVGR